MIFGEEALHPMNTRYCYAWMMQYKVVENKLHPKKKPEGIEKLCQRIKQCITQPPCPIIQDANKLFHCDNYDKYSSSFCAYTGRPERLVQ